MAVRVPDVPYVTLKGNLLLLHLPLTAQYFFLLIAVSYTHLDVYKRQRHAYQ